MNTQCSINVSDIALCQRCPMLLAYKVHMGKKSAWSVGIKGSGYAYGSKFHNRIANKFFEAASKNNHPMHRDIIRAVSGSEADLEDVIRENIFIPFLEDSSEKLATEQIIAMAKGVSVWVKAMSEFFRCIPSLRQYPYADTSSIFIEPEQTLQSRFDFYEGSLSITGRYDALLFNPDETEARIFEFKGYRKSDITVPLSQSLIYSWLILKNTGIVPSIEIIYLDEGDKQPDIFDAESVYNMMNPALPRLFRSAFNILTLRRKPEILHDKDLCSECKYRNTCRRDMTKLFAKTRTGASLVNVLVFFLIALTITAQAFFFLENSAESLSEEREMMQVQLKLDSLVDEAKEAIQNGDVEAKTQPVYVSILKEGRDGYKEEFKVYSFPESDFDVFYEATRVWPEIESDNVNVFDLNYTFIHGRNNGSDPMTDNAVEKLNNVSSYRKIFPSLGENYFLIRARVKLSTGNYIMRQVVVKKGSTKEISSEEVFYW